jgi:hypothetical protein
MKEPSVRSILTTHSLSQTKCGLIKRSCTINVCVFFAARGVKARSQRKSMAGSVAHTRLFYLSLTFFLFFSRPEKHTVGRFAADSIYLAPVAPPAAHLNVSYAASNCSPFSFRAQKKGSHSSGWDEFRRGPGKEIHLADERAVRVVTVVKEIGADGRLSWVENWR